MNGRAFHCCRSVSRTLVCVTHKRVQSCQWDAEALRGLLWLPKMQIHGILMKVFLTLLRFIELEFFIYFFSLTTKQPQDTQVF